MTVCSYCLHARKILRGSLTPLTFPGTPSVAVSEGLVSNINAHPEMHTTPIGSTYHRETAGTPPHILLITFPLGAAGSLEITHHWPGMVSHYHKTEISTKCRILPVFRDRHGKPINSTEGGILARLAGFTCHWSSARSGWSEIAPRLRGSRPGPAGPAARARIRDDRPGSAGGSPPTD